MLFDVVYSVSRVIAVSYCLRAVSWRGILCEVAYSFGFFCVWGVGSAFQSYLVHTLIILLYSFLKI